MPIYLIRHGESEFNAAHNEGDPDPLIFDAELTEKGHSQAMEARHLVANLGIKQVITSPLTRAIQTALIIFEGIAPIKVDIGHHERVVHSCDVGRSPEELKKNFPGLTFDHLPRHWWYQGQENKDGVAVEPEDIFQERIEAFKQSLCLIRQRPVAFIGHSTAFRELSGVGLENCEIHRFQF